MMRILSVVYIEQKGHKTVCISKSDSDADSCTDGSMETRTTGEKRVSYCPHA